MARHCFHRPEDALRRAYEFLDKNEIESALDVLTKAIKWRGKLQFFTVQGDIIELYLSLCTGLRRGDLAKEGLFQYKLTWQVVNLELFENAVNFYLTESASRAEEARKQSKDIVRMLMSESSDLDQIVQIMSSVFGEDAQDFTDHVVLSPWVQFLCESYRNVLDLLKNNCRVEKLYHQCARQAFHFCVEYSRKDEFRELCVLMRSHLQEVIQRRKKNSINLNSHESFQMHVEARFVQIDTAITIGVWQEAFRSFEDIHYILRISRVQPKPAVVANYYSKQAKVYQITGNSLLHTCALHQLFILFKKQNLQQAELQNVASHVVLATLHVPISRSKTEVQKHYLDDDKKEDKNLRLASLLGLQILPTRKSLLADLTRFDHRCKSPWIGNSRSRDRFC